MSDKQLCAVAFNAVSDHLHESAQYIGGSLNTATLYFMQGKLEATEHEQLKFMLLKAQHCLEAAHNLFLSIEPSGGLFESPHSAPRLI